DSQTLEFVVPSMTLSLHDWFLSFGVYVVMGIAFLIIGVAPYYFRASSPAAIPLCFMVMAVFFWFLETVDFIIPGVIAKEMRKFFFSLTPNTAAPLSVVANVRTTLRAVPSSLSCLHLWDCSVPRRIEQLDVFWPGGDLDLYFSRWVCFYVCRRAGFFRHHLVGIA